MAALAARGCLAAVVPGAAPDLAAISARTGVKALGQGSFGLCVPAIGLNASLAHIAPAPGQARPGDPIRGAGPGRARLGGGRGGRLQPCHRHRRQCRRIGFAMALDWLARDVQTGAVLLDLRRIRNRRAFVSAARAVARTRPVVAIRAGGRSADASGIGDCVMEAALRRAGVLRVSGLEDFLSAAETLARVKPRRRRRAGRAARRPGGDRHQRHRHRAPGGRCGARAAAAGSRSSRPRRWPPSPCCCRRAGRPATRSRSGPLRRPRLAEAAAMLAALPEVDSVVALHAPAAEESGDVAAEAMIAAARTGGQRAAPVLVELVRPGDRRAAAPGHGAGWAGGLPDAGSRGAGRPASGARPPQPRRRGRTAVARGARPGARPHRRPPHPRRRRGRPTGGR